MSLSSNKRTTGGVVVIAVWLIYTYSAFAYFVNQKLITFDQNQVLSNVSTTQLAEYLHEIGVNLGADSSTNKETLIHFSDPHCQCQTTSTEHVTDLNNTAQQQGFNVVTVDTSLWQGPLNLIPSVPSVAIIGEQVDFVYYGPYGEGLACSETNGYAQTILSNYLKGFNAQLVVSDAKGCYCNI